MHYFIVARPGRKGPLVARNSIDGTGWLVEQRDSNVVKAFRRTSVWDQVARPLSMTSNVVEIPRIADMDVEFIAKGAAYPEDQSSADLVTVTAKKIGAVLRIAEEDVEDEKLADYVDEKKLSAGSSFAKKYDNAALGVNAAQSGVAVPYTSAYRALTTADATTGYTANANATTIATAAFVDDAAYTALSGLLGLLEDGDYFNDGDLSWVMHPSFRARLRNVKDANKLPLFLPEYVNGREVLRLFGIPVYFTRGAKVTTAPTTNPAGALGVKGTAGNPLAFLIQKSAAISGTRKAFESVYIPGRDGTSALTDEDLLKVRARKAAGLTTPQAHAVLEIIA